MRRVEPALARGGFVSLLTLLGIAVGLAMDAFAVSIGIGLGSPKVGGRTTMRLAWHFGLFQFLMPVIGWLAGLSVERWISGVDHWIAFGLLAAIGGHMIYEALWGDADARAAKDPTRGASLVVLSVATSIDALAVGLSLALLGVEIWWPAVVIGIVAFAFTAAGLHIGRRFGALFGRRMEVVGGIILIAIGARILVDHLF
jgi:putative Mn2+ efflux pump MntP